MFVLSFKSNAAAVPDRPEKEDSQEEKEQLLHLT